VYVGVPFGLGADARDSQPLVQVGEKVGAVVGDEGPFSAAVTHFADDSLR
jgi:hypothetical protein